RHAATRVPRPGRAWRWTGPRPGRRLVGVGHRPARCCQVPPVGGLVEQSRSPAGSVQSRWCPGWAPRAQGSGRPHSYPPTLSGCGHLAPPGTVAAAPGVVDSAYRAGPPTLGPVITATDVELRIGARQLLAGATFRVDAGDRIGLVGRNGA